MTSKTFLRTLGAAAMIGALPFAAMAAGGVSHGDAHHNQNDPYAYDTPAIAGQAGTTVHVSQAMRDSFNATPTAPSDGNGQRVAQAGSVAGTMSLSDGHQTAAAAATSDDIDAAAPGTGNGQRVSEKDHDAKTQS